jgi:hypothetical protein
MRAVICLQPNDQLIWRKALACAKLDGDDIQHIYVPKHFKKTIYLREGKKKPVWIPGGDELSIVPTDMNWEQQEDETNGRGAL